MNNQEFIQELSKIRPSSTFLSLHKYKSEVGEISNFNILFHVSYQKMLERSQIILEGVIPDNDLQMQALREIESSIAASLTKMETPVEDQIDDTYTHFFDDNKKLIKGVKIHKETNALHLYGQLHQKTILTPGIYKKVNSKPLTIEKDKLRKMLPISRFRQFKIISGSVEKIVVENISFLPPIEND